jgi:hypothetical protein
MAWDRKSRLTTLAALAAIAGMASTVHVARVSYPLVRQVVQKHLVLMELRRLEKGAAEDRLLTQAFAEFRAKPSIDPAELLKQSGLDGRVEWREKERRPLVEGWVLRRIELSGADVPFSQWAAFLARLEEGRPAARLVEMSLQPSERATGTGRAAAAVEIIEAPAT